MSDLFLDPGQPLHTCKKETCADCSVSGRLVCHFNLGQLVRFLLIGLPVFVIAGVFIGRYSPYLLIPWLAFVFAYFFFIEIRVMCSHCPHYAEPNLTSLKCWANYGAPKIWKYRPGPMSLLEKTVFWGGFLVVFVYPVPFFVLDSAWVFFGIYLAAAVIFKSILSYFYCRHCINFACPLNAVKDDVRAGFFERNPEVAGAWRR